MSINREKRVHFRYKNNSIVEMRRVLSTTRRKIKAKIIDVSEGGCRLSLIDIQTGFAVGEEIIVSFKLKNKEKQEIYSFSVLCDVRWAKISGQEIGCLFHLKNENEKEIILDIINQKEQPC